MIGAIIAMQCEADILVKNMTVEKEETHHDKKVYIGKTFEKDVVLIVCGVGKVNAACGAQTALDYYKADTLINFGVAGGIKENTETTGVYQIDKAVQYDFDLAGLNGTKIGTLDEFKDNMLPLSTIDGVLPVRTLATGDRFNDDKKDHLLIKDYMQADIRDMEGGAIAQVAIHAGVPVYEWKAISDKAGNVSSFEQYNQNKNKALDNLETYLKALFKQI